MEYQGRTPSVAHARRETEPFAKGLARVANRLLFSVPDLTDDERQLLFDYARDEARYPMKTLNKLMAISRRSTREEDQVALPELVRAHASAPAAIDVASAFDAETEAQGRADVAQRIFERNRDAGSRQAVSEALALQLAATRRSLDAVQAAAV